MQAVSKTRVGNSWIVNLSLRNLASSTQGWEETGGTNRIFRAVEIHHIFCKDALIMAPLSKDAECTPAANPNVRTLVTAACPCRLISRNTCPTAVGVLLVGVGAAVHHGAGGCGKTLPPSPFCGGPETARKTIKS